MATRNNKRNGANDATRHENMDAAMQQVENRKNGKAPAAPTPQDGTPVPAKLEELEARLTEKTTTLNEVKKQSQKSVFTVKCILQSTKAFLDLMDRDGNM